MDALILGLHLATAHTLSSNKMNDYNPGIYVKHASGGTAGVYRSSINTTAAYLGYTVETADKRFALTVGAVTGYTGGVKPIAVPSVAVAAAEDVRLRASFLAKVKRDGAAGLHLSIEWEI